MKGKASKGIAVVAAAALASAAGASSASAGYDIYWEGGQGFIVAPAHHLTKNGARDIFGNGVCVQGYLTTGSGPAWGPGRCAAGANALAWIGYDREFLHGGAQSRYLNNWRARVEF